MEFWERMPFRQRALALAGSTFSDDRFPYVFVANRMLRDAIYGEWQEAHNKAEERCARALDLAADKHDQFCKGNTARWFGRVTQAVNEAKEDNLSKLGLGKKLDYRKCDRALKKFDSEHHSEVARSKKKFDEACKVIIEHFNHDKAVIDAAKEAFLGVWDEEHKKLVDQLMVCDYWGERPVGWRPRNVYYSLPMALCEPLWELERSAVIRQREAEESAAPPVVADNVRLVELKIKKGGKVQLRPTKGLPPPRVRRAAAPKRPPARLKIRKRPRL